MRIDILVSVLSKGINELENGSEEYHLKNTIGKLLSEQGYKKFVVAGSDIIKNDTKNDWRDILVDEKRVEKIDTFKYYTQPTDNDEIILSFNVKDINCEMKIPKRDLERMLRYVNNE